MAACQTATTVIEKNMGFYEDLIKGIDRAINERYEGVPARLAAAADMHQSTLKRIREGERQKWLAATCRLADAAGLKVKLSIEEAQAETAREVCFVDPRIVESGRHAPPPQAEDYIAIPMVGEVGAGAGIISEDDLKSWVLVYRNHASVRFRSNLIAVELGRDAESMKPTLHPGDIVLVDRSDLNPGNSRSLFLVREPGVEGGGKVKRVFVHQKNGTTQVIYYSDNAAENPPEVYDLEGDFDGDISKAIVGRCVWSWSDLTRK